MTAGAGCSIIRPRPRATTLNVAASRADAVVVFLAAIFAMCLASVPLAGGRLTALADVRLRWMPSLVAALAVQVLIISIAPEGHAGARQSAHLGTYAVVLGFIWRNRAVPGLTLIGAGAILNAVAIGANGGVMPASASAMDLAGLAPEGGFENSVAMEGARLALLGDVFAVPAAWPIANVFSVGDVVLVLGVLAGAHRICGSRLGAWRPTRTDRTINGPLMAGRRCL